MGISQTEALDCFRSDDLIGIGMEADAVRRRLHPEGVVTYTLDGRIDYGAPQSPSRTAASFESLSNHIDDIVADGGKGVLLQGTVHVSHTLAWFEGLFSAVKRRFPTLWLHSLSATEIMAIAGQSSLAVPYILARLRDAGLDSIPGNDAGILDDTVQSQYPQRCTATDWIAVHRAAHQMGLPTTATMLFGAGETFDQRVHHLEALRSLQDETRGFRAFTPWTLQPQHAAVSGFEEGTAVEYLKTLAISRMVLDAIENVQSNLATQGLKVLQVSLRFGANDAGSVMLAEGANAATEEELRQVIRDAAFMPIERDTLYRTFFLI